MASPRHSGRSTSLVRLLFIVALVAAIVASSVLGADAAEDTSNRKAPANRHKSGNFKDAMLHPEILDNHAKLVDGKDVGKETKWQITAPVTPVDGTEILDLALEDRILYDRLLSFMKAESSGENLMFLHDLLNYKAVPPVPLEDGREDTSFLVPYANFLYEEYVYPDKAPYEINLSGPNLAELKAAYESGEWKRNSFDSAAIEITNLIVKDVIMRFKTKDEGKFYKAAFGDWAARIDTELKRIKMMLDDERRFWQPRVHKTDVENFIKSNTYPPRPMPASALTEVAKSKKKMQAAVLGLSGFRPAVGGGAAGGAGGDDAPAAAAPQLGRQRSNSKKKQQEESDRKRKVRRHFPRMSV